MKDNYTSIAVIVDASGSMSGLHADTMGSFNTFLKEQQAFPGEATFTLATFNDATHVVHDFVKIANVNGLTAETYRTAGNTALLDAMGSTIDSMGKKLSALPEDERPSKVLVMVITDGQENYSQKYTREQVRAMVEHQRSVYNWEFVFLGASQDAITVGQSYGVAASNSAQYSSSQIGTRRLYSAISESTSSFRSSAPRATSNNGIGFFDNNAPIITPVTENDPTTNANPVTPIKSVRKHRRTSK